MKDQILKALNWRYATKQFDKTKKIPAETLDALLEVLRLAPSSAGTQPWKFVLVSDPAVREKLKAAAYNQPQVTDAAEMIVFCRRTDLNEALADKIVANTAEIRHQKAEELKGLKDLIMGAYGNPDQQVKDAWAARQCYIPLGMLLEAAALMEVDACPMEGFNPQQFDEILGLKEKNLASLAICTLGYRSAEDKYAQAPKARLPKEEVIVRV